MSRTALFALSALAALVAPALAGPVPASGSEMAKRGDHSGQATYFEVGQGACGWNSVDSDWVVALDSATYSGGEHCGKTITMTATKDDGSTATGTAVVVDECPSCGEGSVGEFSRCAFDKLPLTPPADLSPSFFQNFESLDKGVFDMSWNFD
ncbi:Non-catalytic module family EXPN protein [Schizophyllum fasciatum]